MDILGNWGEQQYTKLLVNCMKYVFPTFHNGEISVGFDVIMKGLDKNDYSKSIHSEKWFFIMISNGIYQAMFLQDGQHIKTE